MKTYLITRFFCNAANDSEAVKDFRKKIETFLKLCLSFKGIDLIIPAVFETGSYPVHDTTGTFNWLTETFHKELRLSPIRIQRGGLYAAALNQAIQYIVGNYGVSGGDRVAFISPEVTINQLIINDLHTAIDSDPQIKVAALNVDGLSELVLTGRIQNTGCMWEMPAFLEGGQFPLYADGAAVGDEKVTVRLEVAGEMRDIEIAGNEEIPLLAAVGRTNGPFIAIVRANNPVPWHIDWDAQWQQNKLARKWVVGDHYLENLGLPKDYLMTKIIRLAKSLAA